MRAARKCGPTRGMRFTPCSIRRLRRLPRNLLQNPLEQQIPLIPPVISEAVLIQVGLQVLRAHVVIHAADSPFQGAPKALDCVGVNISSDVDLRGVADALVRVALIFQAVIADMLIGEHDALRQDVFLCEAAKSLLLDIRGNAGHNAANAPIVAALDHADDGSLVLAPEVSPASPAVESFIHLHRRTLQLQTVLGQETPNLAEHAPRCFVGDASLPLNLLCGNSATSRTHEIHCVEPSFERSGALLENSSRERVDVVSARLAGIGGAASHAVMLLLDTALLTLSDAIRPALLFDVLKAGIIIRELGIKIRHCVAQVSRDTLLRFHGRLNCSQATRYRTCCQGIIAFYK